MGREDTEAFVLPPHVLRSPLVMRDAEATVTFATLKASVAEQRSEDDLDLHRIRDDAPEHALWTFTHAMNVGTALQLVVLAVADSLCARPKRLRDELGSATGHPTFDRQRAVDKSGDAIRKGTTFERAPCPPHDDDRPVEDRECRKSRELREVEPLRSQVAA